MNPDWAPSVKQHENISSFIKSERNWLFENEQVRRIAGTGGDERCDEGTLTQAMQNIDNNFSVIGLTERFDESIALMKCECGWRKPLFYIRAKAEKSRPKSPAPDQKTIAVIKERNHLDAILHRYVSERFASQCDLRRDVISSEVEQIRRRNKFARRFVERPLNAYRTVRGTLRSVDKGGSS